MMSKDRLRAVRQFGDNPEGSSESGGEKENREGREKSPDPGIECKSKSGLLATDGLASPDKGDKSLAPVLEQPTEVVRSLFGVSFGAIEEFANLLATEGELRGLIGPKEVERIWSRHIVNCAALLQFLPKRGVVMDVGSGAGLPGIVLAVARPDLEVRLVEVMERRCDWLIEVMERLGLDNVEVIRERSENLGRADRVEVVTARAVAPLDKLLRLTSKLIAPGGQLLALKGRRAYQEIEKAKNELKKRHLQAEVLKVPSVMDGEITYVVRCVRTQ